jgi:hypothetical protein
MNLRESLNNPGHGGPVPNPVEPPRDLDWIAGYCEGYAEAKGIRMAVSTTGPIIQMHNLTTDTCSAKIHRVVLTDMKALVTAVRAQIDAMPYWQPEYEDWGPDPWPEDET